MVCQADLFVEHGLCDHIRSDNGPEFVAKVVRGWLERLDVKPLDIEPGSPWEKGYCESLNGSFEAPSNKRVYSSRLQISLLT